MIWRYPRFRQPPYHHISSALWLVSSQFMLLSSSCSLVCLRFWYILVADFTSCCWFHRPLFVGSPFQLVHPQYVCWYHLNCSWFCQRFSWFHQLFFIGFIAVFETASPGLQVYAGLTSQFLLPSLSSFAIYNQVSSICIYIPISLCGINRIMILSISYSVFIYTYRSPIIISYSVLSISYHEYITNYPYTLCINTLQPMVLVYLPT